MLPTLREYYNRYVYLVCIMIFFICLLLMFSFMRNTTTITLVDAVAALCTIAFAITYNLVREQRSYWLYVIRSAKAIIDPKDLKKVNYKEKATYNKKVAILHRPLITALGTTILACITTYAGYLFMPNYFTYFVCFMGIVIYPLFACALYYYIVPYYIAQSLFFLTNKEHDYHKKISLMALIGWDLFNSTIVNLALVLPIARKPAFNLQDGYYSIKFIIAMLILMVIVGFFTILTAKAKRKYSFIGELFSGEIDIASMQSSPILNKFGTNRRKHYLCYLFICIIWTCLACLLFGVMIPVKSFTAIYLFCLLPLLILFCLERHLSLSNEYTQAVIIKNVLQQNENLVELINSIDKMARAEQMKMDKANEVETLTI